MNRPTVSIAICFGFVISADAGETGVAAVNNALAKSKSTGRPLLLVAGAEWCGPCKTLEKLMATNDKVKAVTSKFIYHHIDVDHDKEAWAMWTKKYDKPGNGIPTIYIVKPSGDLAHSQCGVVLDPAKCAEFFAKYSQGVPGVAVLSPKQIGLMRTAAKEADALLEDGKFVSAYEKLSEFSEDLKSDNKALSKIKATVKKIEQAAVDKVASAKDYVKTGSNARKFEGAFQITIIRGLMSDSEVVAAKVEDTMTELKKETKNGDVFKQADLMFQAREAAREEDSAKAKKLYEKVIADFKDTEAAKRAKAKLDELAGGA